MNNDYADLYFVNLDDQRNADPRDHRVPAGTRVAVPVRAAAAAQPSHAMVPAYAAQMAYPGQTYPQTVMTATGPQVMYAAPSTLGTVGSALGTLTLGTLLKLGSEIVVALLPLPPAPTGTSDVEVNTKNLITYQELLAKQRQREKQLLTIGDLCQKVLR